MARTKKSIIKDIKKILSEWGTFSIGEVEFGDSPCINSMGDLVALAEYFNYNSVDIRVYDSGSGDCDSIHEYEVKYEELAKDVLEEILFICEQYEADCLKTEKRISN